MGRVIFERISMSPGNILRDPISSWCSSLKKSGQSPQSCIKDLIVRSSIWILGVALIVKTLFKEPNIYEACDKKSRL
ncbi:hypothetical protein HZH68_013788 [Vespula germanica]|uniref:Uncharacterized protein n=2 Tax=Vespula TaxID=7451 RepID=A0A834JBX6_VESGE|nr:hypothetical protein HZH68_013788 [Vespula germanica]KAF7404171.1 hypothetical protein H0235_014865 [Vespula pensylvanica]